MVPDAARYFFPDVAVLDDVGFGTVSGQVQSADLGLGIVTEDAVLRDEGLDRAGEIRGALCYGRQGEKGTD